MHSILSFLDLLITINRDNFLTSVYRKKHSIGLYNNYLSFSYKIDLVKTLLHRLLVISNKWSIFHLEIGKTKELLEKNLYPGNFIDQQIKQYLHRQLVMKNTKNLVILHSTFYIGNLLTEIKLKTIKHCKYYFKNTDFKMVFSLFKIGDLFSVKESVSNMVYVFWL